MIGSILNLMFEISISESLNAPPLHNLLNAKYSASTDDFASSFWRLVDQPTESPNACTEIPVGDCSSGSPIPNDGLE